MVGRELQKIRPIGEDHQGLARGGEAPMGPQVEAVMFSTTRTDSSKK